MKLDSTAFHAVSFVLLTGLLALSPKPVHAASGRSRSTASIPVVMEEATVRGKVVMLEDRHNDRQVLKGLKVSVWTTMESGESKDSAGSTPDKLLHEATTDEFGMFDLPVLEQGNYVLKISELQLQLFVIPKAEDRADQNDPKVLLILMPKEVVQG